MCPTAFRGRFTVSRTGPVTNAQPAPRRRAARPLPGNTTKHATFRHHPRRAASQFVVAVIRNIRKSLKRLLKFCRPPPPLKLPCYDFTVDPAHSRDTGLRGQTVTTTATSTTAQWHHLP
ncbi:MAG: hypothetical protein QM760_17920 [Nibricoccus sp.]